MKVMIRLMVLAVLCSMLFAAAAAQAAPRWLRPGDLVEYDINAYLKKSLPGDPPQITEEEGQGVGYLRMLADKVSTPTGVATNLIQAKSQYIYGRYEYDEHIFILPENEEALVVGVRTGQGQQSWAKSRDTAERTWPTRWPQVQSFVAYEQVLLGMPPMALKVTGKEKCLVAAGDFEAVVCEGLLQQPTGYQCTAVDEQGRFRVVDNTMSFYVKIWYSLDGIPLKMQCETRTVIGYEKRVSAEAVKISLAD